MATALSKPVEKWEIAKAMEEMIKAVRWLVNQTQPLLEEPSEDEFLQKDGYTHE